MKNIRTGLGACYVFFVLPALIVPGSSFAALPEDGPGSYSGTYSVTVTGCPAADAEFEGTFTGDWSVTTVPVNSTQSVATGFHNAGVGAVFEAIVTVTGTNTYTVAFQNTPESPSVFVGTSTGTFSSDFNSFVQNDLGTVFTPNGSCTFTGIAKASRSNERVDAENAPSNVITNAGTLQSEIVALASDVSTRIVDVLRGRAIGAKKTSTGFMMNFGGGLNAGDLPSPFGLWGSYGYNDFENDFVGIDGRTDFDGARHSFLGGIDFSPNDRTVMGIGFGYEFSDIDTTFNRGELESNGFSVVPYMGVILDDMLSIDASFGYSWIETDQFRTQIIPGVSTTRVSSDFDSERLFASANLNGFKQYGNWLLGFRTGILWAENHQDEFRESNGTLIAENDIKLIQINAGGDIAYSLGNFEPFLGALYERDISFQEIKLIGVAQPANDDDNVLFRVGVRYFNQENISGNLEFTKRLDREDFDEHMLNASLRVEF